MATDSMDSQCRPTSFLVVDDDAFMLKLISRTLQVLGHNQVLTCNSGAKALAQLDGKTLPDVILCDLNMPGMDGVEFLRKLAGIGYGGAIVVSSGEDRCRFTFNVALLNLHLAVVVPSICHHVEHHPIGLACALQITSSFCCAGNV